MGGTGVLNLQLLFFFKFLILTALFSLATPSLLGSILPTNTNATTTTTTTAAPPASPSSNSSTVFQTYVTREQQNNFLMEYDKLAPNLSRLFEGTTVPNSNVGLTTPQRIANYGYTSETHTVTTDDGYILTLFRIPYGLNNVGPRALRPPVFLMHGLLGCGDNFVLTKETSLALKLADGGYDVWLGNARGNSYSRGHTMYGIHDPRYWDFSWHDMGVHDLPACINYISDTTGSEHINYLGYSMGTTMLFAMGSERPDVLEKINFMIGWAPVAYLRNVGSPCAYALGPLMGEPGLSEALIAIGAGEFLQKNLIELLRPSVIDVCSQGAFTPLCWSFLSCFAGNNLDNLDKDLVLAALNSFPEPTSTKTVAHYAQSILYGDFQQMRYGPFRSLLEYGLQPTPKYNLTELDIPMHFFVAPSDALATTANIQRLQDSLPKRAATTVLKFDWSHLDFLCGKDVVSQVNIPTLKRLNEANGLQ